MAEANRESKRMKESRRSKRRSVAAPTASQRGSRVAASLPRRSANKRRSVAPASQRRSTNSVAASIRLGSVAASQHQQRCSVTGPTAASQRRSVAASQRLSVAASQRQQRHSHSVAASQRRRPLAASQRHSVAAPPAPLQSVAASQRHPPPGASRRNVGNPRFGPPSPLHCNFCCELSLQLRNVRLAPASDLSNFTEWRKRRWP